MVRGDGQDSHGVGVSQTTLPALDSNDRASGLDDVQLETSSQSKSDTIVNLFILSIAHRATIKITLTSVCHWWLSMPLGSGYQVG